MKVLIQPKPQSLINAFLVFFVVHALQIGVGVQGFQRIIYMDAKHDAWISVILAGLATSIISWIMIKTLNLYPSTDLFGIHFDLYGKWLGGFLNFVYSLYCFGAAFVVIRNYIEVVQAWIFPEVPTWFFSITLLLLIIYGITGGFRIIVGVCFFSIILSIWMLALLAYPLQFANISYLFPVFESNLTDILKGVYNMTFTILGFEIIYIFFPFVKEKNKIQKYVQLSILWTTAIYLTLMIISLAYFSGDQLERTIWATLSLFKIVRLPFIERFEYVAVAFWMLIIIPNLMLYLWAASRGMARVFQKGEKRFVWLFSAGIFISVQFFMTRVEINMINGLFAKCAFLVVFCYPVLLFLLALFKKKVLSTKGGES
ncbi:spore germination protein (amino acid permease) [Bacillus pakistanensis]|uniref:Spore germination protein (Amino acid permease) n=1 Tax=Rossellomorea pakistanensis TaxID=992288 RepID=A0ABS2N700_9BACI|nr:GerAB/ArcD/ProY family transporter [Bacillus pakistanensis]MBM7583630.1 spore germination protein (amino acid permease) [Bacillus pakistanensis]